MFIILKIIHKKRNIAPPEIQDIAKLKNNGIKSFKIPVIKKVTAAVGILIKPITKKGLNNPNLTFVFFLIMRIFNKVVTVTHAPIAYISALMPIYCGRNQSPTNKNIEPIK